MTGRDNRGKKLVTENKVRKINRTRWKVCSSDGTREYTVIDWQDTTGRFQCDCYDHRMKKIKCKHIRAIEFVLVKEEFGIDLVDGWVPSEGSA